VRRIRYVQTSTLAVIRCPNFSSLSVQNSSLWTTSANMRLLGQAAKFGCILPSGRVSSPCEARLYGAVGCYPSEPQNMSPSIGIDLAIEYGYVLMTVCLVLLLNISRVLTVSYNNGSIKPVATASGSAYSQAMLEYMGICNSYNFPTQEIQPFASVMAQLPAEGPIFRMIEHLAYLLPFGPSLSPAYVNLPCYPRPDLHSNYRSDPSWLVVKAGDQSVLYNPSSHFTGEELFDKTWRDMDGKLFLMVDHAKAATFVRLGMNHEKVTTIYRSKVFLHPGEPDEHSWAQLNQYMADLASQVLGSQWDKWHPPLRHVTAIQRIYFMGLDIRNEYLKRILENNFGSELLELSYEKLRTMPERWEIMSKSIGAAHMVHTHRIAVWEREQCQVFLHHLFASTWMTEILSKKCSIKRIADTVFRPICINELLYDGLEGYAATLID
jgi:hypothetical protein